VYGIVTGLVLQLVPSNEIAYFPRGLGIVITPAAGVSPEADTDVSTGADEPVKDVEVERQGEDIVITCAVAAINEQPIKSNVVSICFINKLFYLKVIVFFVFIYRQK
jgi:hypothetical protein